MPADSAVLRLLCGRTRPCLHAVCNGSCGRQISLELLPLHVVWGDVGLGALARRILKQDAANSPLDIRGK
jgi:hypothetical protein